MKRQRLCLATILITFLFSLQIFAQSGQQESAMIEDNANACELNSALADQIRVEAANTNEIITVFFRAGNGETPAVNSRRLSIVSKFLRKNKGWSNAQRFIFKRGGKIKGQGRVEFFIGKRLFWTALAKKGRIPCMDCCGFDFEKGDF